MLRRGWGGACGLNKCFFFRGGGRFGEAARVSELFLVRGRGCWDRGLYLVNIFYKEFKSKKKKLGGGGGRELE